MKVQIQALDRSDTAGLSDLLLMMSAGDRKTLHTCLRLSSFSWVGYVGEEIACVWGLVPPSLLSSQAYIWLYTTPVAEEHQFLLVRHSQIVIQTILNEHFPILTGHCLYGADRSIRWLRWLGATFGEPTGKGIPFMIRKKDG